MKNTALVSFIISAFNEERFIEPCICSCLDQTYDNIEVVIWDDGSTDSTALTVLELFKNEPRVKLFRGENNRGKVYGFNEAFRRSRGDYIALMGADDVCYPSRVETSLAFMSKQTQMICGELDQINEQGDVFRQRLVLNQYGKISNSDLTCERLIERPCVFGGTLMCSRNLAKRIFPLSVDLSHEDWYIPVVGAKYTSLGYVDESLIQYRIHDKNSSGVSEKNAYKKWLRGRIREAQYYEIILKFARENGLSIDFERLNYLNFRAKILMDTRPLHAFFRYFSDLHLKRNQLKLLLHVTPKFAYRVEQLLMD